MEQTSDQTEDVKWNPQSEVKRAGTPNLETQVDIIARAQSAAVMEAKGTAHLEVLSIMVRR